MESTWAARTRRAASWPLHSRKGVQEQRSSIGTQKLLPSQIESRLPDSGFRRCQKRFWQVSQEVWERRAWPELPAAGTFPCPAQHRPSRRSCWQQQLATNQTPLLKLVTGCRAAAADMARVTIIGRKVPEPSFRERDRARELWCGQSSGDSCPGEVAAVHSSSSNGASVQLVSALLLPSPLVAFKGRICYSN